MSKRKIYQNHAELAYRLDRMILAIEVRNVGKRDMSDEDRAAKRSLIEQRDEHERKAGLFRPHYSFVMILR